LSLPSNVNIAPNKSKNASAIRLFITASQVEKQVGDAASNKIVELFFASVCVNRYAKRVADLYGCFTAGGQSV
jgi:hypothetical protein